MISSRRLLLPLVALAALPGMARACTPRAPLDEAGFYRDDVGHLPRNARGVMFFDPTKKRKAADFRITSPDDRRPLALRLNRLRNDGIVRLEPVGGFVAHARYTFEYVPKHAAWRYADRMQLSIDDAVVDTAGTYAIEQAPQPEYRMIVVPGSSMCRQPVVALAQPFAYRVPAALAPYRLVLEYGTEVRPEAQRKSKGPEVWGWPYRLTAYYGDIVWRDRDLAGGRYTPADDIVIASCDEPRLRGSVGFPEVDDRRHRIALVALDLGRPASGQCRPLDALVRTMQVAGGDEALHRVCDNVLVFHLDRAPSIDVTEEWAMQLSVLYDLAPTCKLVTLTRALETGRYVADRKAMARLGAGLAEGMRRAEPPQHRQSVDGLSYLAQRFPDERRTDVPALLAPLLPTLAAALAEPEPYRPEALAALIVRAGRLPGDVRATIEAVAHGTTAGAAHARAVLAARHRSP